MGSEPAAERRVCAAPTTAVAARVRRGVTVVLPRLAGGWLFFRASGGGVAPSYRIATVSHNTVGQLRVVARPRGRPAAKGHARECGGVRNAANIRPYAPGT